MISSDDSHVRRVQFQHHAAVVGIELDVGIVAIRIVRFTRCNAFQAVRGEFDQLDRGFPVFNIKTLEARVNDALGA